MLCLFAVRKQVVFGALQGANTNELNMAQQLLSGFRPLSQVNTLKQTEVCLELIQRGSKTRVLLSILDTV